MTERKAQYLIQIGKDDVAPIFTGIFKMEPNMMSPFYELVKGSNVDEASISKDAQTLAQDAKFKDCAQVISNPLMMIRSRTGGGTVNWEENIVLLRSKTEPVAVVTPNINNAYYIQIFDDYKAYIEWWIEAYSGQNEDTAANFIPPKVELGSFVFALHAIDYYRRMSYKSMLDYMPISEVRIDVDDFAATLSTSIKSKDIRWLLPAFIAITPGIEKYEIDINLDQIEILTSQNFIASTKESDTGEEIMIFGEASKIMGLEFMRTWMICGGFEMNVITSEGIKDAARIFIAPTALANHFVRLESNEEGKCTVNHQAYTREQMQQKMLEIFESNLK